MACVSAFQGDSLMVLVWVVAGALFDFLDGFSARLLKAYSPIGKDLDSLADLITFGLSPSLLCWYILKSYSFNLSNTLNGIIPFFGFIIVVFSALRLAKFNTDTRQATSFMGLAVPANALFWCGLLQEPHISLLNTPWILISLMIVFSLLMVSDIPMFSLKFKNLKWSENKIRFIFLAVSATILIIIGIRGIAVVVCWYIILSLLTKGQH
jgi:CDP-diacylglycerol---serine O-phosphatidyltransferase